MTQPHEVIAETNNLILDLLKLFSTAGPEIGYCLVRGIQPCSGGRGDRRSSP
jgi:hypothetical protein